MDKEQKNNLIKFLLIVLAIGMLVCFYILFQYADSEGFKCLSDPMGYAINHSQLISKTGQLPQYNLSIP